MGSGRRTGRAAVIVTVTVDVDELFDGRLHGPVAREREEDVIEAGLSQRQATDRQPGLIEGPEDLHRDPRAIVDGDVQHATLEVTPRRHRADHPDGGPGRLVVLEAHLQHGRAEPGLQLTGRALGDDEPVVDHRQPLGQDVGLLQVLGGEEQRRAVGHELADHVPEVVAAARIEARRRLVEEEDAWSVHERGREVEAAPHAAGVGLDRTVGGVGEGEALEQLVDTGPDDLRALTGQSPDQSQVLPTGELLVDRRVLAGEADVGPDLACLPHDVEPEHLGTAGVGADDRREDSDGRGLAGAVRTEEAVDRAGPHGEVDAVEGVDVTEVLDEPLDDDGGLVGHGRHARADPRWRPCRLSTAPLVTATPYLEVTPR